MPAAKSSWSKAKALSANLGRSLVALACVLVSQACEPAPSYPVLLLHGLNSNSSEAWAPLQAVLARHPLLWKGSTTLKAVEADRWLEIPSADFYTLDFSSSFGLTFVQQGVEVSEAVRAIVRANPARRQVIIVAHSMGGLAARAYLQGLAGRFRDDVAALITVGTPHQGSMEARNCNRHSALCRLKARPGSVGNDALVPGSDALARLNRPGDILPSTVQSYVSVVVTWKKGYTLTEITTPSSRSTPDGRIYGEEGDGIVTATSQDLGKLFSFSPVDRHLRELVDLPVDPGPQCWLAHLPLIDINQVHTCQTADARVLRVILDRILEITPARQPASASIRIPG